MKRFACTFLALCLLFSCCVSPAFALEETKTAASDLSLLDATKSASKETAQPAALQEKPPAIEEPGTTESPSPETPKQGDPTPPDVQPGGTTPAEETKIPSDLNGHWAREVMEKAVKDGYLKGFDDNTLRPDASISKAEILSILTRVLSAQKSDKLLTGLTGDEWYADASLAATALDLIDSTKDLTADKLSRIDAFTLLDRAFCLSGTSYDTTLLSKLSDVSKLSFHEKCTISTFLSEKFISGYQDQTIRPGDSISRAEFIATLYKIAPVKTTADAMTSAPTVATVLSGNVSLKDMTLTNTLYLDCSTEAVTFSNVTAKRVVLRSQKVNSIELLNGSKIETLVLTGGADGTISCQAKNPNSIGTLQLNAPGKSTTVSGSIDRVELISDNQMLSIPSPIFDLSIRGSNCKITSTKDGNMSNLDLQASANGNVLSLSAPVATLDVYGSKNHITSNALLTKVTLQASETILDGTGSMEELFNYYKTNTISLPSLKAENLLDAGLAGGSVTLSAPKSLAIGALLTINAYVSLPESKGLSCEAVWIANEKVVKQETVTAYSAGAVSTYQAQFTYHEKMNKTFNIRFELRYTTRDGVKQVLTATSSTALENYSKAYYDKYNVDKVLARVTTGYKGNRTLDWAKKNDYDAKTKEIWVNAKGYSSKTKYLVWINTTYQRVNIFEGSQGKWKLTKSCIVGTGKPGDDTPVGVYTVGTRTASGWTTSTYNVRPVVRFKMGSGLAFHSRKYNPKHTKMTDASIGYPISLGCIRMYDDDIWWIYDNIPEKTTVVVF